LATPEVDPVRELVQRFFRRFIRDQRGRNQRTAKVEAFFSGLGGEERKFTQREIIPAMLKVGVIEQREAGITVYVFNAGWQTEGDNLIFDAQETERLKPVIDSLREKAGRYNLL